MKMRTMVERLEDHPFLREMDRRHLEFLAGCSSYAVFDPDTFLFHEGQEAATTYLLIDGRASLEIYVPGRGPLQIETVRAGEVIGWSWLLAPYLWHFDARALETTRAFVVDGRCLLAKCEADHELGYAVARRFLYVLQERLERVRLQLMDVYRK